tara:strand:- start:3409 stop:4113 length:705 start_codon:yes stop_codon:yes gene_type:complete
MRNDISFLDSLKSVKNLICKLILLLFILGSCKSIETKIKPDLLPYMLKPVALLPTKAPKNLESVWPDLMYNFEKGLSKMASLGKIKSIKEFNKKLSSNRKLRSAYKTYIDTLTLTGISDKEIALRLLDEFKSPHFLFLDFKSFPCTKECPSDEQWVIRLKLIEVKTGEIIYRARLSHQLDEDEKKLESYQNLAENMISDIMEEFQEGFIIPWHRWRFEHMKKVSEINLRSEMGI